MNGMELHFGMISDRDAIYSGLVESKSLNRQLAICHNSNGKLLVKICTVAEIEHSNQGTIVVLHTPKAPDGEHITVKLDDIESIYPINDFPK